VSQYIVKLNEDLMQSYLYQWPNSWCIMEQCSHQQFDNHQIL